MKIRDIAIRSTGSLVRAKSRTILTTLAVAVGSFALTIALAMGQGGGEYAQRIITANTEARSLWVLKKQDEKGSSSRPSEYTGTPTIKFNKISVKPLNQYDLDKVAAVSGVSGIQPVFSIDNGYVTGPNEKKYQTNVTVARSGVNAVYVAGSGDKLKTNEAIIPDGYREALGFPSAEAAIGAAVNITVPNLGDSKSTPGTFTYVVRGVTKQSTMSLALAPTSILVSQDAAKQLNDYVTAGTIAQNKFIAANAQVESGKTLEEVRDRIIREGYLAQTPGDVYGALYQFVNVLQLVLFGFGILAVLTAVFGIVNTQYISVLERVQEIGLMKALGMDKVDVGRLFKIEAGLIGLIGSSIGVLTAFVTGTVLNPLIADSLTLDPGTMLIKFTMLGTFGVIAGLTVIAIIAGLFPARIASDLDPIDALRSDRL